MGELVFSAERLVRAAPGTVFGLIGPHAAPGFLFGLTCNRLEAGQVVRFELPGPTGEVVHATGRLVSVDPHRRLTIEQESPWRGRLTVNLDATAEGTRVRLRVALGPDCLPWFIPEQSGPVFGEDPAVRLGVLVSLSGSAGLLGRAALNAAELAAEEVNADGGVCGQPLRLRVGDDATSAVRARAEFERLSLRCASDAVVAMVPSASFRALLPAARSRRTLLLHSPLTEAGPSGGTVFQLGERPADQLCHSVPTLMREFGTRTCFVVGNDYCWPRAVGATARRVVERAGGRVIGTRYLDLGCRNFVPLVEQIAASGADFVVSSMVGCDAVLFEREFYDAGLRSRVRTLATLMDDTVREHIGDDVATGVWSVLDHFAVAGGGNEGVSRALRDKFGCWAPPLSSTALSVYEAVHLYARAAHAARSRNPVDVARMLRSGRLGPSRMLDRAAGLPRPTAIAEARPGGFRLLAPAG